MSIHHLAKYLLGPLPGEEPMTDAVAAWMGYVPPAPHDDAAFAHEARMREMEQDRAEESDRVRFEGSEFDGI